MFARMAIYQVKKNELDEGTKHFQEVIIPEAKNQKGYQYSYLLADKETGKVVGLVLYDSEEDALAREKSEEYSKSHAPIAPFITAPPIREGYEVVAQG